MIQIHGRPGLIGLLGQNAQNHVVQARNREQETARRRTNAPALISRIRTAKSKSVVRKQQKFFNYYFYQISILV